MSMDQGQSTTYLRIYGAALATVAVWRQWGEGTRIFHRHPIT
ncbi:hypothetical protein EYZ11_001531 [Aspergillus tanneri]|uniref:Uncharacterized protein n=1 Tax=Aspergillus tanneri TaxID=1220188 RepID=A0A4V3UQJ8_9EURO|nr:hypothetical protein EYZ11_001531 [Aspergillus tanneri]